MAALLWYYFWRLAQKNEIVRDGNMKNNVGSNAEIAVGVQTGDQVQGTDQAALPVESVLDSNADTAGQQDHGCAMQEEARSAVDMVTIMSPYKIMHVCLYSS